MNAQDSNCHPAGVSAGGQYARERRDETAVDLLPAPQGVDLPDAVLDAEDELARASFAPGIKRDGPVSVEDLRARQRSLREQRAAMTARNPDRPSPRI